MHRNAIAGSGLPRTQLGEVQGPLLTLEQLALRADQRVVVLRHDDRQAAPGGGPQHRRRKLTDRVVEVDDVGLGIVEESRRTKPRLRRCE